MDDAVDVNALILKTNDLKVCNVYAVLPWIVFLLNKLSTFNVNAICKQKDHENNWNQKQFNALSVENLNLRVVLFL